MIPDFNKFQREWETMANGVYTQKLSSLSLKLKLSSLQLALKLNKTDIKSAALELYDFCNKHEALVQADMDVVFNKTSIRV